MYSYKSWNFSLEKKPDTPVPVNLKWDNHQVDKESPPHSA